MWQPTGGRDPGIDEALARLAKMRQAVHEIDKHLEWLDATVYAILKRVEEDRP